MSHSYDRRRFLTTAAAACGAGLMTQAGWAHPQQGVVKAVTDVPTLAPPPGLEKRIVLLAGDLASISYHPRLQTQLGNQYELITPLAGGGSSMEVIRNLERWLRVYNPDAVVFHIGREDIRTAYFGTVQTLISPQDYKRNLQAAFDITIAFSTKALPINVGIAPVMDERVEATKMASRDFMVYEADVYTYNRIAERVCRRRRVANIPLSLSFEQAGLPTMLAQDGLTMTPKAQELVAMSVARKINENFD